MTSSRAPEIRAEAPYAAHGEMRCRIAGFSRASRSVTTEINDALETFCFHEAAHVIYHFFWGDFCDWYIEWLKPQLGSENRDEAIAAWRNLFAVFEYALRLLHPFMPFVTEELWHRLPQAAGARSISLESFPGPAHGWLDHNAEFEMDHLQDIIVKTRSIRAENRIDPRTPVELDYADNTGTILVDSATPVDTPLNRNLQTVLRLATLSRINFVPSPLDPGAGPVRSSAGFDLRIRFTQGINKAEETAKLWKEKERLEKDLTSKRERLADDTFRSRAPAEIVRGLEKTISERQVEYDKIMSRLAQLE